MPNSMEDLLGQLALQAPTVLFVAMVCWILHVFFAWRNTVWNDRAFGIISDEQRGRAPLEVTFSAAILLTWPLSRIPTLYKGWCSWMDKKYGEGEKIGVEQQKKLIRSLHSQAEQQREMQLLGQMQILLLAPLREELLFRAPLLLLPALSYLSVVLVLCSAAIFSYIHWNGHLVFVREKLLSWAEDRAAKTEKWHRITSVCFTFVLGLICGLAVVYTQSIWVAILIHMLWNYLIPRLLTLVVMGKSQYVDKRIRFSWNKVWRKIWTI